MNESHVALSTYPLDFSRSNDRISFPKVQGPPSLDYDIASKKRSIAISSLSIVTTNGVIPVLLYYILKYGAYRVCAHVTTDLHCLT